MQKKEIQCTLRCGWYWALIGPVQATGLAGGLDLDTCIGWGCVYLCFFVLLHLETGVKSTDEGKEAEVVFSRTQ